MGQITPAEFEKEIKSAVLKNIYYIYGRDSGRVSAFSELVRKKYLGKNYSSADYTKFEGKNFSISEFADTAEVYPMFTEYNFIEINDFNADDFSADELKVFTGVTENIPPQTVILISVTGFDVKGGKKAPGAKNKKIIDACAKAGTVTEADLRKPAEMTAYITGLAAEYGSSVSKENAEKLAAVCLGDTLRVDNEVHKLASFAGGGEITGQMIDEMVSAGIDTTAFALASAVTSFNSAASLKILDDLFLQRTEAVMILSALSSAFMDLYRAGTAIASGESEAAVAADFGYRGREFVVRNSFRDARKTTVVHLRKCLRILEDADLECKSTRLDQKIIIEKAIVQMLAARNGE
ncbi:MAG: DNA polymerase III subunit delta [Oscillospiraceae bacterium]|nr:DNA polymerase III subunit delta [Oscillospiraceae bacterium]